MRHFIYTHNALIFPHPAFKSKDLLPIATYSQNAYP